jgi:hypothetical protein
MWLLISQLLKVLETLPGRREDGKTGNVFFPSFRLSGKKILAEQTFEMT